MKSRIVAIACLAGLVIVKNIPVTLTTASVALALAAVFAFAIVPIVREALSEVID